MSPPEHYALIGAGPMGLACARNLQRFEIPFTGFELHKDVGGLWDIENPHSTVYESAHLISSKGRTEFTEFPMAEEVADYPSHRELRNYFRAFADHFDLRRHYRFETAVQRVERSTEGGWTVTFKVPDGVRTEHFRGLLLANGTLSEPHIPRFEGTFSGEIFHSAQYKSPAVFEGNRVLVVGAGNSGCDIVVDAVHRAERVDLSMRRGYHFVPKYVFGRPADTLGGLFRLPPSLKQRLDSLVLRSFTGNPQAFGFPEPDHKLYESHPIVNSLVLYHAGHGDLTVRPDVARFEDKTVHFKDGQSVDYDLVLLATGYQLHYPFIDPSELAWEGPAPQLYLNCFHPEHDDLFVMGMIEATGLGWQGRYEQAELVARFLRALDDGNPAARRFQERKGRALPDLRGGYQYLELDRMAYYVNKDTYRALLLRHLRDLS